MYFLLNLMVEKREQSDENEKKSNHLDYILQEYKIVIETQMHFNELIIKTRSMGISVVTVIYGAAAYSISVIPDFFIKISTIELHPAFFIVLSGVSLGFVLFLLDYFYYYRMLLGAVIRGFQFDKLQINNSSHKFFGMNTEITKSVGDSKNSYLKSKLCVISFYGIIISTGVIFLFVIGFGLNHQNIP